MFHLLLGLISFLSILRIVTEGCTTQPPTPPLKILVVWQDDTCVWFGICIDIFQPQFFGEILPVCACGSVFPTSISGSVKQVRVGWANPDTATLYEDISFITQFDTFQSLQNLDGEDAILDIIENSQFGSEQWSVFKGDVDLFFDLNETIPSPDHNTYLWFKLNAGDIVFEEPMTTEEDSRRRLLDILGTINIPMTFTGSTNDPDPAHGLSSFPSASDTAAVVPDPPASMNGFGDPHYVTMDGKHFKYDGPCSYLLLSNICKNENPENQFSMITHHGRCSSRSRNIVCIKALEAILRDDTKVLITNDNILFVNGIEITDFPVTKHHETDNQIVINRRYRTLDKKKIVENVVYDQVLGISFSYHNQGTGTVTILSLPESMAGKTCGLLGNFNGNGEDDFGSFGLKNIDQFGDSWMIPTSYQPLRCTLHPTNSFTSISHCTFDFKETEKVCEDMLQGYFKRLRATKIDQCLSDKDWRATDATRIYDDCITEICECESNDYKECVPSVAIQAFQDACHSAGVDSFPEVSWVDIVTKK